MFEQKIILIELEKGTYSHYIRKQFKTTKFCRVNFLRNNLPSCMQNIPESTYN